MAGRGDATVMLRTGTWPLSLHDKHELLRKLQGRIHFETTLTVSSVSGYLGQYSRLALPCSFIQWHGDKFGSSVILRTDSSPKAWPVTTDIRFMSPASSQVEFSGGWRAFADFNGLLEGDSLVFSLTAMSEFKVHIFRSNGSATKIPSQVQRKRKPNCEVSQKTAAKQSSEYNKNEQSSAEEVTEGAVKSSGLLVAKKEMIAEELESKDSNPKYVIDSSSRRCDGPECRSPTRSEVLRKLQGSIHFEKTLTVSSASGYLGRECKLALPFSFVRRHGDKFGRAATLRTESSTKAWPVSMTVDSKSPACTQVRFVGGWRAFVDFNCLMAGDFLIFSLTAISEFEVYMFPGAGSRKEALPSQLAHREWSNGAVSPTKKAKQSYECKTEKSSAAKSSEGAVKSSRLLVAKKEIISEKLPTKDSKPKGTIGEQCAVSAFGHSPSSLRISFKDSKSKHVPDSFSGGHVKEEESALESDKLTEAGANGGRNNPGYDHRGPTLQKICNRNFQFPGFYKKLGACNIRPVGKGKHPACVEIPLDFWRAYGERLHSLVKLQGVREESEVQTVVCCPTYSNQTRIYLRAGWGDFADDNNLAVGQELLFTLTADSYFVVREVLPPP